MKRLIKRGLNFMGNLVDSPAVILLYHRVIELPQDPQLLTVTPANFSSHLEVLKDAYNLVDIATFRHAVVSGKKLPKKSVIITFDDGYFDNFLFALPILERHNAQGLFYISTSNLDTSYEFWWDNLERIFLSDHSLPDTLNIPGISTRFETATREQRRETYNALHPIVKASNVERREKLIDDIVAWSGLPKEGRSSHRMMTTGELKEMSSSPSAIIGAHTHHHPRLSACDEEEQRQEILTSKEILETLIGKKVVDFSYPFGTKQDYTGDTVSICRELEFEMVASNFHSTVHRWHSPLELPRVLVRNWDKDTFRQQMNSFFKS